MGGRFYCAFEIALGTCIRSIQKDCVGILPSFRVTKYRGWYLIVPVFLYPGHGDDGQVLGMVRFPLMDAGLLSDVIKKHELTQVCLVTRVGLIRLTRSFVLVMKSQTRMASLM